MSVTGTGVYVDGVRVADGLDVADAVAEARRRGGMVWIGLHGPAQAELEGLRGVLALHELAVQESVRGHERSKLIRFSDDDVFVALQPARYHEEAETVVCHEVDVFAGRDYIVTVVEDEAIDPIVVRDRIEQHPEILARGPFAVVWSLLEYVTRGYREVLDGVEHDIDEIEGQLFDDDADVSRRIFALQREVTALQHAVFSLPDVLERLEKLVYAHHADFAVAAFHDVTDRAGAVVERVEALHTTLDRALTVHATLVDQRNNEEMRRMTEFGLQQNDQVKKISSWAAILFAPTLVGTIYGMNFELMPELEWDFGYPLAIGAMLATSITLFTVFKKKDWL